MRTSSQWWPLLVAALVGCSFAAPRSTTTPANATPSPPASASEAQQQASATGSKPPEPGAAPSIVPIPNAREALPGVVTGGVPTEDNLRAAEALGYTTVISLLPPAEAGDEAARVERLGMQFVSIPIAGPADLTRENAELLGAVLSIREHRPLILHCASGNRAGALLALEAFYVERQSAQSAIELGTRAGMTQLRDVVAAQLEKASAERR